MNEEKQRLDELEKRMDVMEKMHPNISFTTKSLSHGIVGWYQTLLLVALAGALGSYLVIKFNNKKNASTRTQHTGS